MIGFINSEVIIPKCFKGQNSIKNQIINKTTKYTFKEGSLFMRGKHGTVIKIDLYLPDEKKCHGITIYKKDSEGLIERLYATTGIWTNEGWLLKTVTIVNIRNSTTISKDYLLVNEMDSPEIFQSEIYKFEEMTLPELLRYKERLNNAGFKNMKLHVDISSRFTYSFVNLIMLILGFSLTLGSGSITSTIFKNQSAHSATQNNIVTAGIGVLITVLYWLSYSFFLSLGYAGAVAPFIAPIITPIIFSILTVFLYKSIQE
ncbi:MAG: LptF/LptG family permease [Thermodesulfovibrionales bacterium]|nr:LptF/LptG family permease [Thermodesulfovibrionales bacterium]